MHRGFAAQEWEPSAGNVKNMFESNKFTFKVARSV